MKCFYHPDRDAVSTCSACGRAVCKECQYITGSHPICRNCRGHKVSTHKANTVNNQVPRVEVNWFYRHLNLTYSIGVLISAVVLNFGLRMVFLSFWNMVLVIFGVSFLFSSTIWVLREKGRSEALSLLLLLGAWPGIIVALCLKNKKQ